MLNALYNHFVMAFANCVLHLDAHLQSYTALY